MKFVPPPDEAKRRKGLYIRSKAAPLAARVARYLREGPITASGLSDFRKISGHPLRMVLQATSPGGPVALKFYDRRVWRLAVSVEHLSDRLPQGLAPSCIHRDVSDASLSQFGLACMGWRWIEGRPLSWRDPSEVAALMRLLADLNGAQEEAGGAVNASGTEGGAGARSPSRGDLQAQFRRRVLELGGIAEGCARVEAAAILDPVDAAVERIRKGSGARRLVQADLSADNIRVTADGRLFLLDLDRVTWGYIGLQLAGVLEHLHSADDLEVLVGPSLAARRVEGDWEAPLGAYFERAPPGWRAEWEAVRAEAAALALLSLGYYLVLDRRLGDRRNPLRKPSHAQAAGEVLRRVQDALRGRGNQGGAGRG